MKTPKFKIGDIVSFVGNNGINIAKINAIILTKDGGIDYYFDGYDEYSKREADLTLYTNKITLEKVKEERKQELPKTYEEAVKNSKNLFFIDTNGDVREFELSEQPNEDCLDDPFSLSKKTAKKHIAFQKLILLRDIYRQGWTPDYTDIMTDKFAIRLVGKNLYPSKCSFVCLLSFQTEEIRDLFFENFKNLIEECKEFIN